VSYVVTDACTACGACLLTCPEHALVVGLPLRVREDRCTSCGECVEVCPADAILELPADHGAPARVHAGGAGNDSMISAGMGWGVRV
jgi:MinD superfamily P-loop ATPase